MQPIQDKDFDQLFKNTFADAEVAPSRDLWKDIEAEIAPKKKRKLPVLWLTAAAILIVATIGILINNQQESVSTGNKLANNGVEKVKPVTKEPVKAIVEASIKPEQKTTEKAVQRTYLAKKKDSQPKLADKPQVVTAPQDVKQDVQLAHHNEVKPQDQDILKQKIDDAIQEPKEETVIANNLTPIKADEPINDNEQSFKNIKNVGDVVNIIVNKVDKRKDKFIQFRTDDDDSSLSSINIGPFKIGKRNKK